MKFSKLIAIILAVTGIGIAGYGFSTVTQPPTPKYFVVEVIPTATASQVITYDRLVEQVAPLSGTTIEVYWGDTGQKLIDAGAIDFEKFEELYGGFTEEQLEILQGDNLDHITFTPENIQFWTNVLWALGLTQESKVLLEGPMKLNEAEFPLGNYASTGGWTIGSKPAVELYASTRLIELTPEQDDLVYSVSENVFRPCCGNHTAFPDCNHGMAVLGLLELMASQGATEDELYEAALTFNSYAFMNTYVYVAAYFALQDIDWSELDRQQVLGYEFSSGRGAQWVVSQVGQIPGTPGQSSSCSPG
ncbi:MAG: hypothetical protein K8I82_21495 [Anaerolineae bacterium]|nr:hypothetical protein [Anaerolineae bacterium]